MARSKKKLTDSVSLFPFLSVLTCTIGVLVLGIFTLSAGYTAIDLQQGRHRMFEEKSQTVQKGQKEIDRLMQLISEAEKVEKAFDEARKELEKLERERTDVKKDHPVDVTLTAEEKKLRERNEALETQLRNKKKQIELLRAALEKGNQSKEDPKIKVTGIAGEGGEGTNVGDLIPYFVECSSDALVIHEESEKTRILKRDLETSEPFKRFLRRANSQQKGIVIFLIRPSGVPIYDQAVRITNNKKVRNGKLPLPGHGELDLSFFKAMRQ